MGPRAEQEGPKMAPKRAQDHPRWGQDGIPELKMRKSKAKRGEKRKWPKTYGKPMFLKGSRLPKSPKMGPRGPREGPR